MVGTAQEKAVPFRSRVSRPTKKFRQPALVFGVECPRPLRPPHGSVISVSRLVCAAPIEVLGFHDTSSYLFYSLSLSLYFSTNYFSFHPRPMRNRKVMRARSTIPFRPPDCRHGGTHSLPPFSVHFCRNRYGLKRRSDAVWLAGLPTLFYGLGRYWRRKSLECSQLGLGSVTRTWSGPDYIVVNLDWVWLRPYRFARRITSQQQNWAFLTYLRGKPGNTYIYLMQEC